MPLEFLCTWLYPITDNQYMYYMYLFHETSMYFSILPLFHCWYIFYFLSCKNTKFDWQIKKLVHFISLHSCYASVTFLTICSHWQWWWVMYIVPVCQEMFKINQKIFWKNSFFNPTLKILVTKITYKDLIS